MLKRLYPTGEYVLLCLEKLKLLKPQAFQANMSFSVKYKNKMPN